jgi:hypothetical protein
VFLYVREGEVMPTFRTGDEIGSRHRRGLGGVIVGGFEEGDDSIDDLVDDCYISFTSHLSPVPISLHIDLEVLEDIRNESSLYEKIDAGIDGAEEVGTTFIEFISRISW